MVQVGQSLIYGGKAERIDYFDLGTHHIRITTTSNAALLWFNRGLVFCYAFNSEKTERLLIEALLHLVLCCSIRRMSTTVYEADLGLNDPLRRACLHP